MKHDLVASNLQTGYWLEDGGRRKKIIDGPRKSIQPCGRKTRKKNLYSAIQYTEFTGVPLNYGMPYSFTVLFCV